MSNVNNEIEEHLSELLSTLNESKNLVTESTDRMTKTLDTINEFKEQKKIDDTQFERRQKKLFEEYQKYSLEDSKNNL